MFISEQHITPTIRKKAKKGLFQSGMPLAKPKHVNLRFTYKEFTLVLGIFVALIIALTIWSSQRNGSLLPENPRSASKIAVPVIKEIVKKSVSEFWF